MTCRDIECPEPARRGTSPDQRIGVNRRTMTVTWTAAATVDRRCRLPTVPGACYTVNYMVQYVSSHLDASFAALSDSTRRGVLEQLSREEASISDLADRFHMTLTGMRKHVGVLEQAGLVVTEKVGRVRTCRIGARRLEEAEAWIERYHQLWDARFGELDQVIEELKRMERSDGRTTTR
jgi:DNA-binding transcriptional ArsR family regulator